ncbi:hypothetical protein G9A89_003153 [Geosiphon pyriformis]|nr:hypothetical protein G9A89_003153 [Geosiphon pyriformis]
MKRSLNRNPKKRPAKKQSQDWLLEQAASSEETCDQKEELDIREAIFRNAQGNIISPFLRPISPLVENSDKMATSYIARLTDFSEEEEETDVYTWLREMQKAIQANNWNNQRAIQTLLFFLKGTVDSWYQSLKTKPMSFAEFKNALLETKNSSNKLSQTILPAVATEDSSLAAIFLFELEENEAMFSGTALDKKCPITAMSEFQPPVATSKNPAPTKDLFLNLRKIQYYQSLKPINSFGLITKEQDYQPYQYGPAKKDLNRTRPKLECSVCKKKLLSIMTCSTLDKDPRNSTHYYCNHYREKTCDTTCQYTILIYNWVREGTPFEAAFNRVLKRLQYYPHNEDELYNTTQTKKESAEVADKVTSYNMFNPVDKFQNYYQQLCPTQQKQKQYLTQINTYLCENCLILCQNQCCEECQDERNLEKKMEIENQQSQNQSINQQDSPDGPESEKFVAYTDLEQVIDIQYFDNGHLKIISERAHPTNTGFDLHYLEDKFITLPFRSITKINLKIVVEIPLGIIIQIASNLMVLLQNNLEKPYTIESKEKIAQAIFLSLVKIGKFVSVENHEELLQTIRGTFDFESTKKKIEANFTEIIEEKGKVIKTEWSIMLLSYGKSEIKIKRTIKEKDLIFEPYPKTCQQRTRLHSGRYHYWIPWNGARKRQPLECYQFMPEELAKLNIGTMDPDQQ